MITQGDQISAELLKDAILQLVLRLVEDPTALPPGQTTAIHGAQPHHGQVTVGEVELQKESLICREEERAVWIHTT